MSTALAFLQDLAVKLQTQDNAYTSLPNYCIEEQKLVCGLDEDYGATIGWFGDDCNHPEEGRRAAALDRYYARYGKEPRDYRRIGYEFSWEHTGISFLTKAAADQYIATKKYKHTYDIRVYVDSHYYNPELRNVRRLLAGPVAACVEALIDARRLIELTVPFEGDVTRRIDKALASLDTAPEPMK